MNGGTEMDVKGKQSSEKRLIDYYYLAEKIECPGEPLVYWCDIESAPTVDAVTVVRCRDCKHHRDKNEQERQYLVEDILICTSPDATDDCWNAVWSDHFCSYGERKEGADNEP